MTDPFAVFAALGTLVLERTSSGTFRRLGAVPEWCRELSLGGEGELSLDSLPFVEAFLRERREARDPFPASLPVSSEIWTEFDARGDELHLQTTALSVAGAELLLVARADALHDTQQQLLQRARDLRMAHESLAREVEQKDVLVHCIIHDLQGPLNTILGTLSLFEERDLPPEITRLAGTAERAALRERDLIRDILQVFAAEHEALVPAAATPTITVDAVDVVNEAVSFVEPTAKARGIRIAVDLVRDESLQVLGDRSRLLRVVSNLLENGLRHARERVAISLSHDVSWARLTVEDDGQGVSSDVAEHLFEKFARTGGSRGGTGLGLYFCRITVERWGGAIGHEVPEGGGARFWVRLRRDGHGEATRGR